jgi:hypothetical protein
VKGLQQSPLPFTLPLLKLPTCSLVELCVAATTVRALCCGDYCSSFVVRGLLFELCVAATTVRVLLCGDCCSSFVVRGLLFERCCVGTTVQALLCGDYCSSVVVRGLLFKLCCAADNCSNFPEHHYVSIFSHFFIIFRFWSHSNKTNQTSTTRRRE